MAPRAHGFLLLPVTLTLVAVGALAYAMTSDASMGVASVEAEYDTEAARYLAEAAFNLARWKNHQLRCNGIASFEPTPLYRYSLASKNIGTTPRDLVGTMAVGENGITEVKNNKNDEKGYLSVDVFGTTTTTPAASRRIARTVSRYDLGNKLVATIRGNGGTTTFIHNGASGGPQGVQSHIELTDTASRQSYGLLRFELGPIPKHSLVEDATLELERFDGELLLLPSRRIDIHRITSPWDPATATWTVPWLRPGGDYAPDAVTSTLIAGNGLYDWHLDTLVAGWVDGTLPNHGVLLKPVGLDKTLLHAFTSTDPDIPKLTVTYYPRCDK
jgi:hypothetical protein